MAYMCLSRVPSTNYLNFKDNEMRTAMMCAVVGGKNDILQLLIYAGADATIKVSACLMGLNPWF
jgi:ankyrin repeat protein